MILFRNLQLTQFPEIKSLHVKLHCCLFIYCQHFRNFCNRQISISITVSSHERSYIQHARMPSPVYHPVVNLVVSLPIRRGLDVFMNISVRNVVFLTNRFFDVSKFTILTLISCYTNVDSRSQLSV